SYNSRQGGFVGSAYVFTGHPTKKLLYNAIKIQHSKISKLLNREGKFVVDQFEVEQNDLINRGTTGLAKGSVQRSAINLSNNKVVVNLDGAIIDSLILAVQGFMYNPNFRNLKCIYVSNNKNLLKRIVNNNERSILGLGH